MVADRPAHCIGCPWWDICGGPNPHCKFCSCQRTRPCDTCPIRCRDRRDVDAWLADVGGSLTLDDVVWPHVPLPEGLPPLIPVLGGPVRPLPPWPAYGVRWDRFLSRDGADVQPRWLKGRPQEKIGAPPETAVVLTLVGPDPPIEALWTSQFRNRIWEKIYRAGFDLVVGPNYSFYGDQPRWEHLLNLKRSILAAARMRAFGIPAVPHIYVWRKTDADRVAEWAHRVGLDAVAHNCQTYRSRREWERALAVLVYWRDRMPPGTRWFFVGVAIREKVQTLRALFPGCYILSLEAYQLAAHGRRVTPEGKRVPWPARPTELMELNIQTMMGWM